MLNKLVDRCTPVTLKALVLSKKGYSQYTIYIICIYDKHTSQSWVLHKSIQSSHFFLIKIFFPSSKAWTASTNPKRCISFLQKQHFPEAALHRHLNNVFFVFFWSKPVSRFATAPAIRHNTSGPSNFSSTAFLLYPWKASKDAGLKIPNGLGDFLESISWVLNMYVMFLS